MLNWDSYVDANTTGICVCIYLLIYDIGLYLKYFVHKMGGNSLSLVQSKKKWEERLSVNFSYM